MEDRKFTDEEFKDAAKEFGESTGKLAAMFAERFDEIKSQLTPDQLSFFEKNKMSTAMDDNLQELKKQMDRLNNMNL